LQKTCSQPTCMVATYLSADGRQGQGLTKFGIKSVDSDVVEWEFDVPVIIAGDVMGTMHQLVSYYY
jgi:hypothetical protein